MSDSTSPDYRILFLLSAILAGAGGLGLVLLMNATLPTVGPRWLFFFLLTLAVTGAALPFVWLLNLRFSRAPLLTADLIRQAVWVAFYADSLVWLQINRSLTLSLALFLGLGLLALEWVVRWLERTRWRPGR
jgi:hypothetical protein